MRVATLGIALLGVGLSLLSLWFAFKARQLRVQADEARPAPRPSSPASHAAKAIANLPYPSHRPTCDKQRHGNNPCTCTQP